MSTWTNTLRSIADHASTLGIFGEISLHQDRLDCRAKDADVPAFFRIDLQKGVACVSLVTPDRWLSQSIEQDLVHTGDNMSDLLDEELADLGYSSPAPAIEHFRSDDKLYTFVSRLGFGPDQAAARKDDLLRVLLAYHAVFSPLGDMEGGDE